MRVTSTGGTVGIWIHQSTVVLTGGMPEPMADMTSLSLGKVGVRALTQLLDATYRRGGLITHAPR
jgi:hypothetical protein